MRFVALGIAALGILWLAMWVTGPGLASPAPGRPPAFDAAGEFSRRIGKAGQAPPLSIAVSSAPASSFPGGRRAAPTSPLPVRHDAATARAVWGAPAEFAPPEE